MLEESRAKVSDAVSSALDFSCNKKRAEERLTPGSDLRIFKIKNKVNSHNKRKARKQRIYAVSENVNCNYTTKKMTLLYHMFRNIQLKFYLIIFSIMQV